MEHGQLLLSKVLDENDTAAFKRHAIDKAHFPTEGERQAFEFIRSYAEQNRGQAPDYREVIAACPDFEYRPQVESSYEWLAKQLKSAANKRQIVELIGNGETQRKLDELDGDQFIEYLQAQIDDIKTDNAVRTKVGKNLKQDSEMFIEEYRKRKAGESFKVWKSKFPGINREIGGYYSGNTYTWHGRSGRGKSVFTMEEVIEAAFQGAKVLIWALEMSWFEWMARAYSSISGRQGAMVATIDGVDYEVGFENRSLLAGKLTDEFEEGFEKFLRELNDMIPGEITVRAVDDEDFNRRDVRQLEADIMQTDADVVLVDAIYLMDYEANTSKVAGGDVANTSKKLRRLSGQTQTVIHLITQAEEVKDVENEDGQRELRASKRSEIKKTKAVLEDAAAVFGIDTMDGRGVIEIGKARQGGEDAVIEVLYLPNYGIVKELQIDEKLANQFVF